MSQPKIVGAVKRKHIIWCIIFSRALLIGVDSRWPKYQNLQKSAILGNFLVAERLRGMEQSKIPKRQFNHGWAGMDTDLQGLGESASDHGGRIGQMGPIRRMGFAGIRRHAGKNHAAPGRDAATSDGCRVENRSYSETRHLVSYEIRWGSFGLNSKRGGET